MENGLIPALTTAAHVKRALREHLRAIGYRFVRGKPVREHSSKEDIRKLYASKRESILESNQSFLKANLAKLKTNFANGSEIDPSNVEVKLEVVHKSTWQSDLFRLATLTWSVPVSSGYGRRIRFLVWDSSNGKLMGILALGDPVFNLAQRDANICWSNTQKSAKISSVMDAFVLGAVPPYSYILGGKVIASLLRSKEIKKIFSEKYKGKRSVIARKLHDGQLSLITTTSSLGRSSIYNRLSIDGQKILTPSGYSNGWGHFHISDDVFKIIRKYLEEHDDPYSGNHQYGQGPNWRLRAIRKCLEDVGFDSSILNHGIKRQIFLCPTHENSYSFLREESGKLRNCLMMPCSEISSKAINRWMIPRARRDDSYKHWTQDLLFKPSIKKEETHIIRSRKI